MRCSQTLPCLAGSFVRDDLPLYVVLLVVDARLTAEGGFMAKRVTLVTDLLRDAALYCIGINSEFVTVIDGGTSIHNRRPCASSRRAESVIRNRAKLPALTVLALGIAACQGGSGELTVEDLAVIRQVTRAWQFHVGVADWESLMVVYTSNAVFMPPNGPTLHGHDAIRTFMAEGPAITQVSLTIEEIDGGGNLAFVRGTYTMTLQPEGAPEPVQDRGKYVQIRRKQADGAWLIAVDIFNSDLPDRPGSR